MITTVHFIIGGAVGAATGNPLTGFAAGFVSHMALDSIPHLDVPIDATRDAKDNIVFDRRIWTQVAIDGVVGLAVVALLWGRLDQFSLLSPFAWGTLGGVSPDLIDNMPFWNKTFRSTALGRIFHPWHNATHTLWKRIFPMRRYWRLGLATQAIACVGGLMYLFGR